MKIPKSCTLLKQKFIIEKPSNTGILNEFLISNFSKTKQRKKHSIFFIYFFMYYHLFVSYTGAYAILYSSICETWKYIMEQIFRVNIIIYCCIYSVYEIYMEFCMNFKNDSLSKINSCMYLTLFLRRLYMEMCSVTISY